MGATGVMDLFLHWWSSVWQQVEVVPVARDKRCPWHQKENAWQE